MKRHFGTLIAFAFLIQVHHAPANESNESTAATLLLRELGLEELLVRMATEGQAPRRIDDITVLNNIEANGTVLRFEYSVDTQDTSLGNDAVQQLSDQACNYEPTIPIITAGAVIQSAYYNANAKLMAIVSVDAEACGF